MKFYILANQREPCKKHLDKMLKHLTTKPTITFGEVERKTKTVKTTFAGDYDELDVNTTKYQVDVILVSIEDLAIREWRLVASVYHYEGVVAMVDSKLFKDMPKQFGLDYHRCDFCGSTRGNRKISHVLYNTVTNEWKQVGSECVNKVINGAKSLAKFVCDLYEFIQVKLGGCEYGDFDGWSAPDHSRLQAISLKQAVALCRSYREHVGTKWVKSEWDGRFKTEGTNDKLQQCYGEYATNGWIIEDEELFENVCRYVDTLNGGFDWDGEPDFNQRIKDAFADEYICFGDIYLAYFALKGYEDSIGKNAFLNKCKEEGIEKDGHYNFSGVLESFKFEQSPYVYGGYETVCTFKGDNGMTFEKKLSGLNVLAKFTKEKIEDEFGCIENRFYIGKHYDFSCSVKYIVSTKEIVVFGGRMSKTKK